MPYIRVDENIFLSQMRSKDIGQLVRYLNDKEVYDNTLRIPYPYTREDGEHFINLCEKNKKKFGKLTDWAIRDKNKKLIGGCGFQMSYKRNSKKDEIGYWLARSYWNKGIMTKVVNKLCEIGFNKFGLTRIEADVFLHNNASCRVLEKAGFKLEGIIRKSVKKENRMIDAKTFFRNKV